MIQVIRTGECAWQVSRVTPLGRVAEQDAHEYETLGRVVLDGGLYWAERAQWSESPSGAPTYRREGRGHLLQRGALAVLLVERVRS